MTARKGTARSPRARARRSLCAAVAALLVTLVPGTARVEAAKANRGPGKARTEATAARTSRVQSKAPGTGRQHVRATTRRHQRAEPAHVMILTPPGEIPTGGTLRIAVRLNGPARGGHHAAVSLGVDPAILEYQGFEPTGRGALLVEPSPDHPGELAIYRSSLPEGFAASEDLAVLDFQVKRAGHSLVTLTEVRVMDEEARDLPVSFEASEVFVD